MRVAVLGDGLLARHIRDQEPNFTILGHDAIEVTDPESVKRALDGFDVAINTVAFHRLKECEDHPQRAYAVNAIGAENVARVLPTVYISTDYVFTDGGPHEEVMPGTEPRNVYGRSKLAGEISTLKHGGIVVRVASLFGHHPSHKGPTFPETVTQSFTTPLKVPTDQVMSPTYCVDAAERIVGLATAIADPIYFEDMGRMDIEPTGIYHAANAGSTNWAEFAKEILAVTRLPRKVEGFAAKDPLRPKNSSLRSKRLPPLRHWRLALDDWAAERQRLLFENRVSPLRSDG